MSSSLGAGGKAQLHLVIGRCSLAAHNSKEKGDAGPNLSGPGKDLYIRFSQ